MGEKDGLEPTARGDLLAQKVRRWYEDNRESWWDRHKLDPFGRDPDRLGTHADEWMLRFIGAVGRANDEINAAYGEAAPDDSSVADGWLPDGSWKP